MKNIFALILVLVILPFSLSLNAQQKIQCQLTKANDANGNGCISIGNQMLKQGSTFDYDELITLYEGESLSYIQINPPVKGERTINFKEFQKASATSDYMVKMSLATYDEKLKKMNSSITVPQVTLGTNVQEWTFVDENRQLSHYPKDSLKIALIIGNERYHHMEGLNTSRNSAYAVGDSLRSIGFNTLVVVDADFQSLSSVLQFFYNVSEDYETKLFYYVGHGISDVYNDYVVPIDVTENNIDSCFSITEIAKNMQSGNTTKVRLLFYDACRNPASINSSNKYDPGKGAIIMYSTDRGFYAYPYANESDKYTIFSHAFLNHITVRDNLYNVLSSIKKETESKAKKAQKTQIPKCELPDEAKKIFLHHTDGFVNHSYFYWGASAGYLYGSAYIGGQIGFSNALFGLLEFGWSVHLGGKSDEVYLYNSSNVADYGYVYTPNRFICPNLHIGVGYAFTDNFSMVLLYAASYLGIKGSPIADYISGRGEKAAAICHSPNLRAVWAPKKSSPWMGQLTIGYDFAVGDGNYIILKNVDKIKSMAEGFRCQIGFIRKF